MDLFRSQIFSNAASHAGWPQVCPDIRAVWTPPIEGEDDAPTFRIVHCRLLQLHGPARLHRLGLRQSAGYAKCGSKVQIDWVTSFRLLLWDGKAWIVHRYESDLPRPADDDPVWFDLGSITAQAAILELRRCGIDDWWTSWNLALGAPVLEGETATGPYPRKEIRLAVEGVDLSSLPKGVAAAHLPGEVRYTTPFFQVGFGLGRAGFTWLSLDGDGKGNMDRNLLRLNPAVALQGIRFLPVGSPPAVAPLLRHNVSGSVRVHGATITYEVSLADGGQRYRVSWEIQRDSMRVRITRHGATDVRVWDGTAWTVACNSEVTPTCVLGRTVKSGETGILPAPVLFHAPGHGTLQLSAIPPGTFVRSDSHRPLTFTTLALKVGELPQSVGDYLLPAGNHEVEYLLEPHSFTSRLRIQTPVAVSRAITRCALTAMSYRADTATLSNNGNSMHAPLCMDNWSAVALRLGDLLPGFSALDLLRDSLERWLDGGPGYASGGYMGETDLHRAEDEYVMTGTAALLGLGEFLNAAGTEAWLQSYAGQVQRQLQLMRARDTDRDGIVESPYRDGTSGGHQWSTNWYDVISFGWKDAFANALLYRALVLLGRSLPRLGRADLAIGLDEWASQLKGSFLPAFFNPATGWLAGWRSKDGRLHDYAFLAVNGAAVNSGVLADDTARDIMRALLEETKRVGMPDPRLGLPGNLRPVPDDDMITLMHGRPMGYYINGGLTHSQSFRFVGALYRVGITEEADAMLEALCSTLADGSAFGGCGSGIDWRYWDGGPCGYEGLLTDQFGILAVALERYREPPAKPRRHRGTDDPPGE